MTTTPCQLIFKRSKTKGRKPQFTLTAVAEMTPEFESATHEYGMWNQIIYADPRLDEARELQALKADRKIKRRRRVGKAIARNVSGETAIFLLPFVLLYKILKLIYIGPIKLLFWIFKAFRQQKKQIMRFRELKQGKSFTSADLMELAQIEETIKESVENITAYVGAAANYGGDVAVQSEAA